jgi:hypothetical protein
MMEVSGNDGEKSRPYRLIGVDQGEASKLRRKLDPIDPWDTSKSERVKYLVQEIANSPEGGLPSLVEPRYDSNVYPLFYLYAGTTKGNLVATYNRILQDYLKLFPEHGGKYPTDLLMRFIEDIANTEIDLLIEDTEYFIFVEAKDPPDGKLAKFEKRRGVHQLVVQYAQGLFLEKQIEKRFFLATLGAKLTSYDFTPFDRDFLKIVGSTSEALKFCDLRW